MENLNFTEIRIVNQGLCTTDPPMTVPSHFEPEIYSHEGKGAYRFQCSITGLVFRMEGEGEVLYRTVPWDRRRLAQKGGCDFLSVAHVTDESMEFLLPREATETHIILNITGFCKYGITKEQEAPVSPIRALVLLFYQLPDDNNKSTLNVLLLPRNVDIAEACGTSTSSSCPGPTPWACGTSTSSSCPGPTPWACGTSTSSFCPGPAS